MRQGRLNGQVAGTRSSENLVCVACHVPSCLPQTRAVSEQTSRIEHRNREYRRQSTSSSQIGDLFPACLVNRLFQNDQRLCALVLHCRKGLFVFWRRGLDANNLRLQLQTIAASRFERDMQSDTPRSLRI